jgi:hypothetical protein
MKLLQVIPKSDNKSSLKALLKQKERELRGRGTSFYREREGLWKHVKHQGWIKWQEISGGLLVAEIQTRKDTAEWQLLQAFIGYLDRHFGDQIESISIIYR